MIHVLFFLLILSLVIGGGVVFLFVTLNRRVRQPVLTFYVGVLVCLGIAIFSDLFTIYISLVLEDSPAQASRWVIFSAVIYHLMMGGLVYFLPQFVGALLDQPISDRARAFLLALTLFYPSGVIAYFLTRQEIFATIGDFLLLLVIAHTLFRLYPRPQEDENPSLRKIGNMMLILLAVFLPLFCLEVFFEPAFSQINRLFFDTSVFLLTFYLIWNVVNAGYLYKQFDRAFSTPAQGLSAERMAAYQLSDRQQQIARLIAEGASNRQISVELSISAMTVKNHVYNIYKKTGATNRVELVNILTE